jgi:hypothetical protein
MFLPDPGFLSISGPRIKNNDDNKREREKIIVIPFCCQIFHKIKFIYSCIGTENKVEPLTKNYSEFYPKKNCHNALRNMDWGSGIWKKTYPDPGVEKAPDPGSVTLVTST